MMEIIIGFVIGIIFIIISFLCSLKEFKDDQRSKNKQ